MKLVECELIENCLAHRRMGNKVQKKPIHKGTRVRGVVTNVALTPDSQVLALQTQDGFIIPEPFLNVIGEVKNGNNSSPSVEDVEAEVVSENSSDKSVKDVYDSLKASKIISSNRIKSKRVVNFALIGGGIALVYALVRGKNKLVYAGIGAVGGGIVGNYIGRKIAENEKTEQ
jgi:hypothetical protein